MPAASSQLGATAMRSRATNQMQTNGPKLKSCATADSTMPTYVSGRRLPENSSSCATAPGSLFFFAIPSP